MQQYTTSYKIHYRAAERKHKLCTKYQVNKLQVMCINARINYILG